jgi:hypothetical protein
VAAGPSGADADGGRDKGEAEQVLLDKAVKDSRHVFPPAAPGSQPRCHKQLTLGY